MRKGSLSSRLLAYLRKEYPSIIPKAQIERIVIAKTKYTADNAGRRLRELEADGLIEVSYLDGKNTYYKASAPTRYILASSPDGESKITVPIWE